MGLLILCMSIDPFFYRMGNQDGAVSMGLCIFVILLLQIFFFNLVLSSCWRTLNSELLLICYLDLCHKLLEVNVTLVHDDFWNLCVAVMCIIVAGNDEYIFFSFSSY